ncbi:hypothetical protein [Streptomyces gardneri]|uniref:hypothetical protein n=1 Tax=Streptomyces gardneri TaxID=66892 RepID=UPI0036BD859F
MTDPTPKTEMVHLDLATVRQELLLPVIVLDDASLDVVARFYAASPPRVGEDFRGRPVTRVSWDDQSSTPTGLLVQVYIGD